jgi:hypothetical protein
MANIVTRGSKPRERVPSIQHQEYNDHDRSEIF